MCVYTEREKCAQHYAPQTRGPDLKARSISRSAAFLCRASSLRWPAPWTGHTSNTGHTLQVAVLRYTQTNQVVAWARTQNPSYMCPYMWQFLWRFLLEKSILLCLSRPLILCIFMLFVIHVFHKWPHAIWQNLVKKHFLIGMQYQVS